MTTHHQPARLSPADADALDALVEAGFDASRVPPFLQDRAQKIAAMLDLLEPPALEEQVEIDLISPLQPEPTLSVMDAAALDALVNAGWTKRDLTGEQCRRASLITSVVSLLDTPLAPQRELDESATDALIDATLARIDHSRRIVEPVASSRLRRLPRFRPVDLLSAAAILLIATSILMPMLTGLRDQNIRVANAARLANAGLGFSLYANDHNDQLPASDTSYAGRIPGVVWWNVGAPNQSHSANLFVLAKDGYATLEDLASPTNPHAPIRLDVANLNDWRTSDEVSYSYQLLGARSIRWTSPSRQVVLTDRSPVIEQARQGQPVNPLLNSFAHRGAGQSILFNDRSVRWTTSPVLPWGDNIWLPRSLERRLNATLRGVELPEGQDDAFVGP